MRMICKPIQPLFGTDLERLLVYHKLSENRQPGSREGKTRSATTGKRVGTTASLWIELHCTGVRKL